MKDVENDSCMENSSDDGLVLVDKTLHFLQKEFCPLEVDNIWSAGYFLWNLG